MGRRSDFLCSLEAVRCCLRLNYPRWTCWFLAVLWSPVVLREQRHVLVQIQCIMHCGHLLEELEMTLPVALKQCGAVLFESSITRGERVDSWLCCGHLSWGRRDRTVRFSHRSRTSEARDSTGQPSPTLHPPLHLLALDFCLCFGHLVSLGSRDWRSMFRCSAADPGQWSKTGVFSSERGVLIPVFDICFQSRERILGQDAQIWKVTLKLKHKLIFLRNT